MIRFLNYLLFFSLIISFDAYGQSEKNDSIPLHFDKSNFNSWSVNLGVGNVLTVGDLSTRGAEKSSFDIGFNLGVTKMFNSSFGLELSGIFGTSHTYKNKYNNVDLNGETTTPFISTQLSLVTNLSNLVLSGRNYQRKWNFSLYTGVGMTFHKAYFKSYSPPNPEDQDWANNDSKTDQYTRIFQIPVGLGVRYRLSKNFDLGLRGTASFYGEDSFDGRIHEGEGANDIGFYTGLSLVWKIGNKDRSLEWADPLDEEMGRIEERLDNMSRSGKDTDGDGVPDEYDLDNETPEGVMVAGNGRALDTDKDGIEDYKDIDPFTTLGAETDQYGKELDSDFDGIGNSKDIEPNTEIGAQVNWQGATIKGNDLADALIPSIFFKLNSSSIDYKAHNDLVAIAKILSSNPKLKYRVIGYADKTGSKKYNQKLGLKRANAVIEHLATVYGIEKSRLEAGSAGADEPLSKTKSYYSTNRRVDFKSK